jgi:putative DNA primase/helicase
MNVKCDFDLDVKNIIPKELPKEDELIEKILKDVGKINIQEYLKKLGVRQKFRKDGEPLPPPQKHIKIVLIDYLLEVAENKEWKIAKDESGMIYIYNGIYWMFINEDKIKEFLKNLTLNIIDLPPETKIDMKDEAFIDKLYKQLISAAPTKKRRSHLLINLQNGTFNLKTMELQEFDPDDFLTYQLPFPYDPQAVNPLWGKFIKEVIPNNDTLMTLQEVLGSVFIRNIKFEKAFFFYGGGANGKSVIADVMDALLGKNNISHLSIEELKREYHLATLKDKLLNIATESDTKDLKSDLFKKLVSGEKVMARHPYGRPFEMEDYAKFIFYVNEIKLKDIEYTEGFFRRFLIIPFKVTIPKEKRDKELAKKIINTGLSGVFNWIIEGAKRVLLHNDIFISEECETAFQDFLKDVDSVSQFLDYNNLVKSDDNQHRIYIKDLYQNYKEWCFSFGLKPVGGTEFSRRLTKLGFIKKRSKEYYFLMKKKED